MTKRAQTARAGGFTLIEMMVVVVIIVLLAALTVVAAGSFIRSSRRSAEQQNLRSLSMSTEQFQQRFKFSVPLVDDFDSGGPVVDTSTDNARVRIAGESATNPGDAAPQQTFLSYENPAFADTVARYSELSIPYFLMGVLPKKVDGVDGPGMTTPLATARGGPNWRSFDKRGGVIQPLYDIGSDPARLVRMDSNGVPAVGPNAEQQTRLVDRWGRAVRYYRWEPLFHVTGVGVPGRSGAPANNATQSGEIRDYNAPHFLGDPRENPSLRPAKWALVSRGADGLINEANPNDSMNADNIVVIEGGVAIEGGGL